jgi:alternate signal-mediated exported protein
MKKKKNLIIIFVLFFIVVVGTTIAYFQSSAVFENLFTTGIYKVVVTEIFEPPTNWKPGETVTKTITTTNEGTIPAAVRMKVNQECISRDGVDISDDFNFFDMILINDVNYDD